MLQALIIENIVIFNLVVLGFVLGKKEDKRN